MVFRGPLVIGPVTGSALRKGAESNGDTLPPRYIWPVVAPRPTTRTSVCSTAPRWGLMPPAPWERTILAARRVRRGQPPDRFREPSPGWRPGQSRSDPRLTRPAARFHPTRAGFRAAPIEPPDRISGRSGGGIPSGCARSRRPSRRRTSPGTPRRAPGRPSLRRSPPPPARRRRRSARSGPPPSPW